MPYKKYIEEIRELDDRVRRATVFHGNEFRSALCDLITEIPMLLDSEARRLCQEVFCPPAFEIVEHLQKDIDNHADNPEYAIVLYPLMRVAIAIRSGEVTKAV